MLKKICSHTYKHVVKQIPAEYAPKIQKAHRAGHYGTYVSNSTYNAVIQGIGSPEKHKIN